MKQLFKHAVLLDAVSGSQRKCDILLEDGVVCQVADEIATESDMLVVELEGAFVTDGWVDAHTHLDWEEGSLCLDADTTYASDGLTYVIDAGTNGPSNYEIVHDKIQHMPIRAKAYLNVAVNGTCRHGNELKAPEFLDEDAFCKTYEMYPDEIIGVKIRIDPRVNGDIKGTLARARKLADRLSLPLIVHPTRCPEPLETVLQYLGKNDVFAHTYSSLLPCILDEEGVVKKCVRAARERGVWFDLAHGSANFSFDVARKAMEQDFVVDTISTDLHTANIGTYVRSMAETMSKMLYLGMPLPEIIHKVTVAPAKMLGLQDKHFGVAPGTRADLTVFRVEEGSFRLTDSYKNQVISDRRIVPVLTVWGERIFNPRQCIWMKTYHKG